VQYNQPSGMKPPGWHAAAALVLVLIGSLRIISTYRVFNHTIDEPDNLAAGMEYLSTGRYLYEDVHPPLARVFAAVGPFLAGERFHPGPEAYSEGYRILGQGAHYDRVLALGRAGILPFFWAVSLVVYLWARRAGGPAAALAATLLITTTPPVLALAGIINTDAALGAMVPAAALGSLYWAERPSRARSLGLGLLIGLACVSKFSALPFLAVSWALMAACGLLMTGRTVAGFAKEAWSRRRSVAVVMAIAVLVVWVAYGFTFARVGFLNVRLPAPRFFSGIHAVWVHSRLGHPAYLWDKRSTRGFWYYFPAVLALKTPLGLVALVFASFRRAFQPQRPGQAMALAFAAGVLLASMAGHINLGVRYILPAYAGLCVAGGCAAAVARGWFLKVAAAAFLVWHVASGGLQHPDYLAYTNEIAGNHPERFVADSDLDWGQDMKRLAQFLHEQGAVSITFTPFNRTYPMPLTLLPGASGAPSPGWNAVSVTIWKVFGFPSWADRMPEQRRIGKSILLWYFPS